MGSKDADNLSLSVFFMHDFLSLLFRSLDFLRAPIAAFLAGWFDVVEHGSGLLEQLFSASGEWSLHGLW